MIWRLDGQRRDAGEGAKGRREREKFSSTVGWSRKSCNIATARSSGRWAMSLTSLIQSRPIHLSAFLSPCSHSPDELATIFLFLSSLLLCSHYALFFFSFPFVSLKLLFFLLSLCLSPPRSLFLSPSLSLSGCPDLSDYCSSQTTAPSGLISHLQVWCQPLGQQVVLEPTCRQHLVLCWTWLGCTQRTGRKDWLKKQRGRLILLSREREWCREWVGW